MNHDARIDDYVASLRSGLRSCPGRTQDLLDEVRDHLSEARDRELAAGATAEEAERRAVAAFGDADQLARSFTRARSRRRALRLLPFALAVGFGLAWTDSRPTWDDTGISALAVLLASAACAALEPARPWLWALAVGVWLPLLAVAQSGNWGATLALAFAFAGAFGASSARRAAAGLAV